jgi:starch synthase (maltosyl-transferring)
MKSKAQGARIYNLFPRLIGRMDNWGVHFDRIRELGFDWVYVNPFHYPGFSGSLYAPKDYYEFNPLFIDTSSIVPPMKQLESMLEEAHQRGLRVIMDLVINHTAKDHPFTRQHPEWYRRDEKGEVKSPGAWDNGQWIEWGDLAEIDNENAADRENLWNYWKELVLFYIEKGFDGFRADAAYQVPAELWKHLISAAKQKNKKTVFFAESLGCTPRQTHELAKSGFEYIFNSSKWWNFTDPWLLEQYNLTKDMSNSISFPESHDTIRIAMELNNNLNAVKQRTVFSALFSTGWMIPVGYEYGFRKKLDVIQTFPKDWEPINYDLTDFIRKLNQIKVSHSVFNEENDLDIVHTENENQLLVLRERSRDRKESALLVINKDVSHNQKAIIPDLAAAMECPSDSTVLDISVEREMSSVPMKNFEYILNPGEVRILIWKRG